MPACYPPNPAGTNPQLAADKILARGNDAVFSTHHKKHQNRRAGCIEAWWNTVNRAQVADNFAQAKA
jgi:superoxide dismutase